MNISQFIGAYKDMLTNFLIFKVEYLASHFGMQPQ